jgi:hypothetical protein
MPITFTGITNDLLSSTIYNVHDQIVDGLFQTSPFLSVSKKLGKIKYHEGSFKLVVPIETQEQTTSTQITTGWEPVNMAVQEISQQAQYDYSRVVRPVLISGKEEASNRGEKAIINLAEARHKAAIQALMRELNRQIVQGGVSAFSGVTSLNGNTGYGGSNTGFLEAALPNTSASPTSQTNTVGQLARGLVPGLNNQFVDGGGTVADILKNLYTLEAQASTLLPAGGDGGRFHLTLASMKAYAAYRNALFANERFIDAKSLDAAGVQSLAFSSGVMMPDRDIGFGQSSTSVENDFMLLNLDGIFLDVLNGADFAFTGFMDYPGYDGRYGQIVWQGGLCAGHIGSSALYVDAT